LVAVRKMQLKNEAAWLLTERAPELEVVKAPFPECGDEDIIIKTHYVAINPVDWKIQASGGFGLKYPAILGEDVVGEVIEVGNKQKKFRVGQRVVANAQGFEAGYAFAGFQLYPAVRKETVCSIPDDISFEDAVVIPLSISTASAGLYLKKALSLPLPDLKKDLGALKENTKTLLLWGGSSSVGSSVIQLAAASGYHVITTASPSNYQYCKDLGARSVWDYHNPDVVTLLTSVLKGTKLAGAYDAIGSDTTVQQCASVLHNLGGGKVVSVVSSPKVPDDVEVVRIQSSQIVTQEPDIAKGIWSKFIPAALKSGQYVPAPKPLLVGEGLETVQKGFDRQKEGVSARKIVIKL
jgi:NADPH:quinone reductase-like Zn-dependent oxidoreductase